MTARVELERSAIESTSTISSSTKLKGYNRLPTPRGYPLLGTLPDFIRAGGVQQWHQYTSKRHQELGGIYMESFSGSDLVFLSDPAEVRKVYAAEGQYPKHFLPESWLLYNKDRQVDRGLLFM